MYIITFFFNYIIRTVILKIEFERDKIKEKKIFVIKKSVFLTIWRRNLKFGMKVIFKL